MNWYELPEQMLAETWLLTTGRTVNVKDIKLSHPFEEVSVSEYVPEAVSVCPLNWYELPEQMLAETWLLTTGRTVNVKDIKLSHPFEEVSVSE